MSTFIIDQFAVARFPVEALRQSYPDHGFYEDHYLFFLLGGDNNVFTVHDGRERRARSWRLLALGQAWSVMSELVHIAADCEGGCVRFSGERATLPETLIRRARKAMVASATSEAMIRAGLNCLVTLSLAAQYRSTEHDHVRKGIEHLQRSVGRAANLSWALRPLDDMAHAAALFACHFLADEPIRHHAQVTAPRYENRPLMLPNRMT